MTPEEFIDLIETAKPVNIEDIEHPEYGFIILFDNGRKIQLSAETSFDQACIEFTEL